MEGFLSHRLNRRQVLAALAAGGLSALAGRLGYAEHLLAAPAAPIRWRKLAPKTAPTPRFGAAMAYDMSQKAILLCSGDVRPATGQSGTDADTWTWNGRGWTQRSPQASPPARSRGCMAFHPPSGMTVLFGGGNLSGFLGDTWLWNGRTWAQGPAAGPAPRAAASMGYDPQTENLILFGGFGDRMLGDTWAWNGRAWRLLNPEAKPLPTRGATMAFSAGVGRLVMYGGTHFQGSTRGSSETWAWDGRSWSQLTFINWPVARRYAAMASDPAGTQVLLFGGFDDLGVLNDTWMLGTEWVLQNSTGAPTPRAGSALAFNPSEQSFVLFGGGNGRTMFDETWAWGPLA